MPKSLRVAVGGLWHETNTFAAERTGLTEFESYQLAAGQELLERYGSTRTELGGMIATGKKLGFELQPLIYAAAVPAGTILQEAYEALAERLLGRLQGAMPLDGVLLTLHGAAVAEETLDLDADLLKRVREVVGPSVPILATFDFHANIGTEMVAAADVLIGYDTFPHTDMFDRGAEAAQLLHRIQDKGARPKVAFCKLPLLTVPQMQATGEGPLVELFARLHEFEARSEAITASIALGFPYADVPQLGATVLAYADTAENAKRVADDLAGRLWSQRDRFTPDLLSIPDAVSAAVASHETPVVLVDPADNVGGGAPGDSTHLLAPLLAAGATGAVAVIWDPEVARAAAQVGVCGRFLGRLGGKTDELHGMPVEIEGRVVFSAETSYRHEGSYMHGFTTDMGLTAVLEVAGNLLVVTSLRTMPFDLGQLRCVGIEPAEQRILIVKSARAWQAAFGPIAKNIIFADTAGVCPSNLVHVDYQRCPRPIYPLDKGFTFQTRSAEIEFGASNREA